MLSTQPKKGDLSATAEPESYAVRRFLAGLSDRESGILSLLATGHSNSSIAETLSIEAGTVEQYINNMHGRIMAGANR